MIYGFYTIARDVDVITLMVKISRQISLQPNLTHIHLLKNVRDGDETGKKQHKYKPTN